MPKKQISRFLLLAAIMVLNTTAFADNVPTLHQVYATVQAGRLDEAQKMITLVIQALPDSAKAHYVDTVILVKQGQMEHAKTELNTAQRLAPGLPFAEQADIQDLQSRIALGHPSVQTGISYSNRIVYTVQTGVADSKGFARIEYLFDGKPVPQAESANDMFPGCKEIWARPIPDYAHKKARITYFEVLKDCAMAIESMNTVYNPDDGETKDWLSPAIQTAESRIEQRKALTRAIPDWEATVVSQPFKDWAKKLPPEKQAEINSSWNSDFVVKTIKDFKQSLKKTEPKKPDKPDAKTTRLETTQPAPVPIRINAIPDLINGRTIPDISRASDPVGECLKMLNGVMPIMINPEDTMVYSENYRYCGALLEEMDAEDKAQQH